MNWSTPSGASRRFAAGRWWVVAALLGAATLWAAGSTVHDRDQRRAAAAQVAQATAEHVVTLIAGRLEVLGASAFAPATPWSTDPPRPASETLPALVALQGEGERCRCRPLAPATDFFQVEAGSDTIAVQHVPGADTVPVPRALLLRLARAELALPLQGRASVMRLLADRGLPGQVILLAVQADARGEGRAVFGLLAHARATAHAILRHDPPSADLPRSSVRVIILDTLSLALRAEDGSPVFGVLAPERTIRATVHPAGALAGLALTVALAPDQVPYRVLVEPDQLWLLALLTACTVILVVIAAGASRRETLLARARSDFIAGISHDLRMPLAQILLAGETLALGRADSAAERGTLAESIVREARRLTGLVDNVLQFSRSGAAAPAAARGVVLVEGLLREVAESVRLSVADAGQTLDWGADAVLRVWGDRSLLRQALVNLVDNALKYGPRGQTIRLTAVPEGPDLVRLVVEDQGPGIPVAERARLFEAYARLADDQVSERTGSGLGLTVVRGIAEACGGSASLEEAEGGGTRAVIILRSATDPADAGGPVP